MMMYIWANIIGGFVLGIIMSRILKNYSEGGGYVDLGFLINIFWIFIFIIFLAIWGGIFWW